MNTLHEQLNEALELWVALTGVDPMNQSFNLQSYHVQQTYEQLNAAQKLDPTGLTTAMLLRAFVEEWTREATYSANDLLNRPTLVQTEIEKMRKVIEVLERPEVTEPTDEFLEALKKAVAHYEIDDPDTDKLLADQFEIAYLRRDAMQAIKNLSSHQFSRGEPSGEPIKYGKKIYQFWNVNSLIREIARTPMSAVVLSLVRDPEAYHSYFVFAIRNGGNISVLTDKTNWDHPAQKEMQRRPDRKFAERAFRYHFPYNLMEFCVDEDSDRIRIPKQEGLVRYNTEAIVLGKMNQVPANSMIWLTMMLTLINDRYWGENDRAPALSYTGEMAEFPKVLKEATTHLPVLRSKLLELPRLTVSDITHDRLIKTQRWAHKPTGFNEWMVDRYGDKVPENVLNLVGDKELRLLPSGQARELTKKEEDKREEDWHKELEGVNQFRGLDPTEFGTRKQLVRDAAWAARYNQAKVVGELARMEYERDREKVFEWFEARVRKNKPVILHAVAAGEFKAVAQTMKGAFDMSGEVEKNILRLTWRPDRQTIHHWGRSVVTFGELADDGPVCCITGQRASVFGSMTPMVPQAIAALAGCRVEDLPWGLQRYYVNEPYHGNPILNRLDPMDWIPKNPWKDLNLRVIVYLTKRAFNGLRKDLGLPKFVSEDWDKIKDESGLW